MKLYAFVFKNKFRVVKRGRMWGFQWLPKLEVSPRDDLSSLRFRSVLTKNCFCAMKGVAKLDFVSLTKMVLTMTIMIDNLNLQLRSLKSGIVILRLKVLLIPVILMIISIMLSLMIMLVGVKMTLILKILLIPVM